MYPEPPPPPPAAGEYSVKATVAGTLTVTQTTTTTTLADITKTYNGTNQAASGATSYQISMSSSSGFTAHTNGAVYNAITDATGTRTVYVRSVCDTSLYSSENSTNASKGTTVFAVSLTAGTGIDSVSGAGNYITGATATISATVFSGYTWTNWTGSSTLTANPISVTVNAAKSYTANATANTYTVKYCQGNNSGTAGYTCSTTTSSHTYNVAKNLTAYASTGLTAPSGWTFNGWNTTAKGTTATTANTTLGSTITPTYNGASTYYGVYSRAYSANFYSGVNHALIHN